MDDLRNVRPGRSSRTTRGPPRRGPSRRTLERNFSGERVVPSKYGVHSGHEGLKELAQLLREEMPGAAFEYTTQLVEGDAAFLE